VTGLCDEVIHRTCRPIVQLGYQRGPNYLRGHSARLLEHGFSPQALGQMYIRPGLLRETALDPPVARVRPVALHIDMPGLPLPPQICRLDASLWSEMARWIDAWSLPGGRPRSPRARALWDALKTAGALTTAPVLPPRGGEGLTFVGHATVLLQQAGTRI